MLDMPLQRGQLRLLRKRGDFGAERLSEPLVHGPHMFNQSTSLTSKEQAHLYKVNVDLLWLNLQDWIYQSYHMEQNVFLARYALGKLRVILNDKNHQQSLAVGREGQQAEEIANALQIECKVVIREGLNHCLKRRAELFKVWVRGKCISVNLITKEGLYSFLTMNYYQSLQVLSNNIQDKVTISIDQATCILNSTAIFFKVRVHQDGKTSNDLANNNEIFLQFGSPKRQSVIKCEIVSLQVHTLNCSNFPIFESKIENNFEFIDERYSTPIGIISSPNQIYDILSIQPKFEHIENLIKQMPKHTSVPFDKQNKLYLCHDMKGGYIQDVNFSNNTIQLKKPENFHYRSFHLQQSEIFNYFSHYNITIPPLHWRTACNIAGTKCLGTFIIQQPAYSEHTLASQQFALFLVAIARKCRFDGYLINIETKISSIGPFKKWLGFLTTKMHQHIPNSVIIWYDSISQKDGVVRYQNGLSEQNIQFFNLTDGLFTNYWWNEQLLKKSIHFKNKSAKKLYIGNDCFGRNTYEGGMYHTYKAANKILQYKNEVSIALFAPGFTYEDNGEYNRQLYHLNELSMYKGVKMQSFPTDRWKILSNKGNGWKTQGEWSVTSYDLCERSAIIMFNEMEKGTAVCVQFMVRVMGTPPVAESPYKIVLQVLDQNNNVVHQNQAHNFNNYKKTTDKEELCVYQVNITEELVGNGKYGIKVIEMGKSSANWAGHFGPRFKQERVLVLIYEKERHWVSKIPVNQVEIGKTYHSLCNAGMGDYFYLDGEKMQKNYNFLVDCDLPHTHIINNPFDTELNYQDSFFGGTSLKIKKQALKLLKVFIPKGLNLKNEYFIQVTVKDTFKIDLVFKYISKNEEERIFTTKLLKSQDVNGWKRFTFKLMTVLAEVKSDIRSIIDIVSQRQPYLLGEIKILQAQPVQKSDLTCRLEVSRDYTPNNHYYFNVLLTSSIHKRLLVVLQNVAAFAYFIDGKAYLSNISIQKCQSLSLKVVDVDSNLEHVTICGKILQYKDIVNLILKGYVQL